jgi:hypothetical protein
MDVATETLYSQESPEAAGLNSAGFKLARLARTFRGVLITNPAANISIVGYLSRPLECGKNRLPDACPYRQHPSPKTSLL